MAPQAGSNLRNRSTFPRFAAIPNEQELDTEYWTKDDPRSAYLPRREWCFLGEIGADSDWFVRLSLDVSDVDGSKLRIFFHTPDRGESIAHQCAVGYTIAVLNPKQHYFSDGQSGFRIEEIAQVKIIPFSLRELLAANDKIFARGHEKCFTCEKTPEQLTRCKGCRQVSYCGTGCENAKLGKGHQEDCPKMKAVSWFTERSWRALLQQWWAVQAMGWNHRIIIEYRQIFEAMYRSLRVSTEYR